MEAQVQTKSKRVWKYGKEFVKTKALRKYKDETGLSSAEIAYKAGENVSFIERCIYRNRTPREVLDKLGIRARQPNRIDSGHKVRGGSSIPAGGTIYACYVGASEKDAFLAFCSAMHINAKDMI